MSPDAEGVDAVLAAMKKFQIDEALDLRELVQHCLTLRVLRANTNKTLGELVSSEINVTKRRRVHTKVLLVKTRKHLGRKAMQQ